MPAALLVCLSFFIFDSDSTPSSLHALKETGCLLLAETGRTILSSGDDSLHCALPRPSARRVLVNAPFLPYCIRLFVLLKVAYLCAFVSVCSVFLKNVLHAGNPSFCSLSTWTFKDFTLTAGKNWKIITPYNKISRTVVVIAFDRETWKQKNWTYNLHNNLFSDVVKFFIRKNESYCPKEKSSLVSRNLSEISIKVRSMIYSTNLTNVVESSDGCSVFLVELLKVLQLSIPEKLFSDGLYVIIQTGTTNVSSNEVL